MLQFSRTRKLWIPSGQVKPTGLPSIDWTHPLTRGLVAYGFDTGWGFYAAMTSWVGGGYGYTPPYSGQLNGPNIGGSNTLPRAAETTAPTPYGEAIIWQGHTWSGGLHGWLFEVNAPNQTGNNPIQHACYLSGKVAGSGNSLVCGFMQNGTSPYNVTYFGRSFTPDNYGQDSYILSGNTGILQAFVVANSGGASSFPQIGNTVTGLQTGVYYTGGVTMLCTSTTAATGTLYLNGQPQGTTSGVQMVAGFNSPTAPAPYFPGFNVGMQSGESELCFGGKWHDQAPELSHVLQGFAYWGGLWNRPLSGSEHVRLHWDPYCFLIRRP